jgi:hypothetical protein
MIGLLLFCGAGSRAVSRLTNKDRRLLIVLYRWYSSRDAHPLAPLWLLLLLALEVAIFGRPAADRG